MNRSPQPIFYPGFLPVIELVGLAFYLEKEVGVRLRNYYLGFGAAVFIVWWLTRYKRTEHRLETI